MMMMMMIVIAVTKHDLGCTGCKKGLILGTRRLKSEVTHTSLVKRTLTVTIIIIIIVFVIAILSQNLITNHGDGTNDDGEVDHRKAMGFGESHL